MNIPNSALVLVADGRRMLFLRNEGGAAQPRLVVEEVRKQNNPANRDQTTDRPGRSHSGIGPGRSALGEADFHQIEEDRFAAEAAEVLRKRALSNDFADLIVIAPPRTLGELRGRYHKEVSSRITAEFDKDLTSHPVNQIEAALLAA